MSHGSDASGGARAVRAGAVPADRALQRRVWWRPSSPRGPHPGGLHRSSGTGCLPAGAPRQPVRVQQASSYRTRRTSTAPSGKSPADSLFFGPAVQGLRARRRARKGEDPPRFPNHEDGNRAPQSQTGSPSGRGHVECQQGGSGGHGWILPDPMARISRSADP